MSLSLELGILLLQVSGIHEDDLDDIVCGVRAVYLACEPLSYQLGQQAGMVEMGVGEEDSVNSMGRDGKGVPVPCR